MSIYGRQEDWTQVSVYVTNRMVQNLELYIAINFNVGIIGRYFRIVISVTDIYQINKK